jgi:hypothetical protein
MVVLLGMGGPSAQSNRSAKGRNATLYPLIPANAGTQIGGRRR